MSFSNSPSFRVQIGSDIYAILLIDLKRAISEPKSETLLKFCSVSWNWKKAFKDLKTYLLLYLLQWLVVNAV